MLQAMFPLIFCGLRAQKFWCVRTFLEMTKTCQPRTLIRHNVSVRSKFMRVRRKLCAQLRGNTGCKCTRMRFHCANGLLVLRICAP